MKKLDVPLLINSAKENRIAFITAIIVTYGKNGDGDRKPTPHFASLAAVKLASLASLIHAHAEALCNREVSEREENQNAKNCEKFAAIADFFGFDARTAGDPRGACAFLIDRTKPDNGDGWGDGWAVYR